MLASTEGRDGGHVAGEGKRGPVTAWQVHARLQLFAKARPSTDFALRSSLWTSPLVLLAAMEEVQMQGHGESTLDMGMNGAKCW